MTCRTCKTAREHDAIAALAGVRRKGAFPWDRAGRPFGGKAKLATSGSDGDPSLPENPPRTSRRRELQPGETAKPPHELQLSRGYRFPGPREDEPDDEEDDLVPGVRKARRTGGRLDMVPILAKPVKRRPRYAAGRFDGARIPERTQKRKAVIL